MIDYVTFRIKDNIDALKTEDIIRVFEVPKITKIALSQKHIEGMFSYNFEIYKVINLRWCFNETYLKEEIENTLNDIIKELKSINSIDFEIQINDFIKEDFEIHKSTKKIEVFITNNNSYNEDLEIISLQGTLGKDKCHIHISASDNKGKVYGGHLKKAIINTTAEIVITNLDNYTFSREFDEQTGFKELIIK